MSITITRLTDSATTTPVRVALPYEVTDESRNVETDLLSGDMAITLITPRPGAGALILVYGDETTARAARDLHRGRSVFSLADTVNAARNMTYALGSGGARLVADSSGAWTLVVSFREVEL